MGTAPTGRLTFFLPGVSQIFSVMKTVYFFLCCVTMASGLIRLDWETLSSEVALRYFNPENYYASTDPQEIWDQMGENITCTVDQNMVVTVVPPSGFDAAKPIKLLTHGFVDTMINDNTQFISAWMDHFGGAYSVVLVDWHNLAYFAQISDWDDWGYVPPGGTQSGGSSCGQGWQKFSGTTNQF